MNGLQRDDAGDLILAHTHTAADEHPGVNAAGRCQLEHTVLGDVLHQKAHFIHMGEQGQRTLAGLCALLKDDQVAHGVHFHGGGVGRDRFFDKLADFVLIAGNAVQCAQLFQQFFHGYSLPSKVSIKAASSLPTFFTSLMRSISTGECIYFSGRETTRVVTP